VSSSGTAVDKASQVYTLIAELAFIDAYTGFDQRHGAAQVFPGIH
jgi:hypothetical protein